MRKPEELLSAGSGASRSTFKGCLGKGLPIYLFSLNHTSSTPQVLIGACGHTGRSVMCLP